MEDKSCKLAYRIIFMSLTAFAIAFAFIHSSMPADESGEESLAVLNYLQGFLNIFGFGDGLTDNIVRKCAHFIEYTAIGALALTSAFTFSKRRFYRYAPHVLFVGLFTAVLDETIQLGVDGRAGMVTDVLLDFSGVVAGAVVMTAVFIVVNKL